MLNLKNKLYSSTFSFINKAINHIATFSYLPSQTTLMRENTVGVRGELINRQGLRRCKPKLIIDQRL